MATILDVWQPVIGLTDQNGEASGQTAEPSLLVKLDVNSDGRVKNTIKLLFADYAGLEAEWIAKVAITVLLAAVNTAIGATDLAEDQLSSGQRGIVDTVAGGS